VTQLKALGLDSMEIVALRVLFSAVILVLYLLVRDRSQLKIKLKDIGLFFGTGVLSIVFFNYCYFQAITLIGGASIPALLLYTAPIFVMVISVFVFKEKITVKKVVCLAVTFLGLALVTGAFSGGEKLSLVALAFGLGSGLGYALYSIFGKFLVDKYSAITITTYTFVVATVFSLPTSGIIPRLAVVCSPKVILLAVALALISTVMPFLLYTKGLNGMEAGKASILATVEPLVATIVGVALFNETLTVVKVIGMAMIFVAIVLLNINGKKKI
jgi:drug/metabolite transporter (DMT)-like permease